MVLHFLWRQAVANQQQSRDQLTDGPQFRVAISDSSVASAVFDQGEEVVVMRNEGSILPDGERDLLVIGGFQQSNFLRRGHVDSPSP